MATDVGMLPGSVATEDARQLHSNQDKLSLNGTSAPGKVSPTCGTQCKSISSRQSDSGCHIRQCKMRLNIGGVVFKTHSQTLQRFPETRLARLTTQDESYDPDDKEFFFDRNSMVFHGVLDYYRTGELHVPHNICARVVHNELTFWGFQDKELCECCWQKYQEYRDTDDCIRTVMATFHHETGVPPLQNPTRWHHYQNVMWNILEYPRSSCLATIWAICFSITMFASIFITVFESMSEFRVESDYSIYATFINATTNPKEQRAIQTELHPTMVGVELISSILLTIDLLLRLIFCPSNREFFKSILNWIEIISQIMVWYVASHYIPQTMGPMRTDTQLIMFSIAMCLRNMRVLRVFRMARHLPAWRILVLSLRSSTSEILALSAFVFTGVLVFAILIYSAQFYVNDEFTNVPIGFWWAVVTMTTVGYGDFYPTTIPGYIVGALCAVSGMLATGLPIPIIANNFNLLNSYYKMSKMGKSATTEPDIALTLDDHTTKSLDRSMTASSTDSAYEEGSTVHEGTGEVFHRKKPMKTIKM